MTVTTVKRLVPHAGDTGRARRLPLLPLLALALLLLIAPVQAFADIPVHVTPSTPDPDSCALCHRTHSAAASMTVTDPSAGGGSALLLSPEPDRGDVGLCYLCHGIAVLGASTDVETSLTLSSAHLVAPSESPTFGPNPKMCSNCHDSHGTDRRPDGSSFPGLLRAWTSAGATVTAGEEYCDTCHQNRAAAGSRYDSLSVYRQTQHYRAMLPSTSATGIRCLECHEGHGSSIAPLISGQVKPPAALGSLATETVTSNDRTLCVKCHSADLGTWANSVAYEGSSHAKSATEVPVPGEWPDPGAKRKLGECQVCHAPMGRAGAGGTPIPDLAEKPGRQLCDTCHQPAGPASTDLKSLAGLSAGANELAVVYAPSDRTEQALVSLYGGGLVTTDRLLGPRQYHAGEATATAAKGDVSGDASAELVVARVSAGAGKLTVYTRDALLGLTTAGLWDVDVAIRPDFVATGKFVGTPTKDQIAVVDATTGDVAVYGLSGSTLSEEWSGTLAGGAASGLASGNVTGTAQPDLAITDAAGDELHILTWDDGAGDMVVTSVATGDSPRGPSIGDAWPDAGNEIVVCDTGDAEISVFDGSGTDLGAFAVDANGGDALPYASVVSDVVGDALAEVSVALYSAGSMNYVNIFDQDGAGLVAGPDRYETGDMYGTASIAAGDVNGDGTTELVVGNGGRWSAADGMVPPSVQVVQVQLGWMTGIRTYTGGGAELAGRAPALAVADFGPVLPSRHPVDEVATSHLSTETAPFTRHVTCADCHNPHEAKANDPAEVAPAIKGTMLGSWGITAADLGGTTDRSVNQYETCYKCHSSHVTLGAREDISASVDPGNASVHAVEAPSSTSAARPGTFNAGWSNASVLYCSDCHGNATAGEPRGGHRSSAAPLLKKPLLGVGAGDSEGLCYLCHPYDLYRDGTGDTGAASYFYASGAPGTPLHRRHSGAFAGASTGLELSCLTCHVSHGSATGEHLVRSDIGYTHGAANTGSCDNACHGGVDAKSY